MKIQEILRESTTDFQQALESPQVQKLRDMGFEYVSTSKQVNNGTMAFKNNNDRVFSIYKTGKIGDSVAQGYLKYTADTYLDAINIIIVKLEKELTLKSQKLKIYENIVDMTEIVINDSITELMIHDCSKLRSLNGIPNRLFKSIHIFNCVNLKTLDHIPPANKLIITDCINLESAIFQKTSGKNQLMIVGSPLLKQMTTPKICNDLYVNCDGTDFRLLRNAKGKKITIFASKSLTNINRHISSCQELVLRNAHLIESNILSLLLINGLQYLYFDLYDKSPPGYMSLQQHKAFEILRKYVGQGQESVLACQRELIENNLEEYAYL